ncbi:MAG: hypothetical protein GXO22_07810 [Aquificae bacterium]|nr:hypothetical protein [Aquificota bacterium]
MFKLIREVPAYIEITITPNQLISMFPIELQEHPTMGQIERVWKTNDNVFSVDTLCDCIVNLSKNRKHIKVCDDKMLSLLNEIKEFDIVLFYEGKEDKYQVKKI